MRVPDRLERLLQARARRRCELCGRPANRAMRRHHRWQRSQGGVDDIRNLVLLHVNCHNTVHANPVWAYETGWLVDAPHRTYARRPLLLYAGTSGERRVLLTADGSYADAA